MKHTGEAQSADIIVQHTDILPTILNILGLKAYEGDYYKWDAFNVFADLQAEERQRKVLTMSGRSFIDALLENHSQFRDHVTVAWDSAVTLITDTWWLNCKVNGRGAFLYDLRREGAFSHNLADSKPKVVRSLFELAKRDAGGDFPEFLVRLAEQQENASGCSDLSAKP